MQLSVSPLLIFIVCSGFKYWIIQWIILATATTLIEKMTQETFITNMHARIKKNISRKRSSYFSCCYLYSSKYVVIVYIFSWFSTNNALIPLPIPLSPYLSLFYSPSNALLYFHILFQLVQLQSHVTQYYYYIDLHNSLSNY